MIFWPLCFALVKEDREAIEGFGNPAFSMSNPDLSAHQTSEEKIIRHDTPDRILAAHQQKSRLPVSAELKGVTSVLIIFILCDSCCLADLTWAPWNRRYMFHSRCLHGLPGEVLDGTQLGTLRIFFSIGMQAIISYVNHLCFERLGWNGFSLSGC